MSWFQKSWLPSAENVDLYSCVSQSMHGITCVILASCALDHNRKGPKWIKGYIAGFIIDYFFLVCAGVSRLALIYVNPQESW